MTSVSFPFFVGKPDPQTKQIALMDAEFRFTTKATRKLEDACNGNIDWLVARGQSVKAAVLLVCYGLLWDEARWRRAPMTEDRAADLIDEFIDAGGDVGALAKALYEALAKSGVYGKPKPEAEGDDRPTETTASASA